MLGRVGFRLQPQFYGSKQQENHHDDHNYDYPDRLNRSATGQMNRELTPEQFEKMIHEMMNWATPRKENAKSATGKANATLIEKIARDGRITREDEQIILSCLDNQRGWWQALMVVCTLNTAIIVPLLVVDEIPDNGHFSESMHNILSLIYYTGFGISFFVTLLQLLVVLLIYALSCYVIEMKSTLYLFMQCHDLFVYTNSAGMFPVLTFITSTVVGHVLMVGPIKSIPCVIMGILTIILCVHLYAKIIKPIFFGIFDSEFGTWESKRRKRRNTRNLTRQGASQSLSHLLGSVRASFKTETVRKAADAIAKDEEEIDLSSWKEDVPVSPPEGDDEEIDLSCWNEGRPESSPLPTQTSSVEATQSSLPTQTSSKPLTQSAPVQQHQMGMQQGGLDSIRANHGISKRRAKRGSSQSKNAKLGKQQTAARHDGDNGTYQPGEEIQDCCSHGSPILASEKAKEAPPISRFGPISPQETKVQQNNRVDDSSVCRNERSGLLHDNIGSSSKPNPTQTSSHPREPQLDQQALLRTSPVQHQQTGMQQRHNDSIISRQRGKNREIKKEREDNIPGDIFFDEEEDIKNNPFYHDESLDNSEESSNKKSVASKVTAEDSRQSWWEGHQNDELEVLVGRLEQERKEEISLGTSNKDADETIDIERGGVPKRIKKKNGDSPFRPWDEIDSGGGRNRTTTTTTSTFVQDLLKDDSSTDNVKDSMMQQDLSASLRQRLAAHAANVYDSLTMSISQQNQHHQSLSYHQRDDSHHHHHHHDQKEDYRTRNEEKNPDNRPAAQHHHRRHHPGYNNHTIHLTNELFSTRKAYPPDPPDFKHVPTTKQQ